MGQAYTYRCRNCGYETRFNEGHGYRIHRQPLDVYLGSRKILFHYKTHRLLNKLSEIGKDFMVYAGFRIYKCPQCRLLYDKIEVKVLHEGKVVHRSEFRCMRCRARLKLTNIHRLKTAVCPVCKKETFRIDRQQLFLWG